MDNNNNGTGMVMPVSPMYGGGYGGGSGFFGGDWAWIILLLLIGGNGWGFGGFGGGMMPWMMGGAMNGFGLDYLYPWLNNSQHISDGFRDQMLQTSIGDLRNDVTAGFGNVQLGIAGINQNICQTGNNVTGAIRDGFYAAEAAANTRQIADMQQNFALQSQLAQCCCDNRAATADLKYTVANENCADRTQAMQNTRDIIDSQTRSTQAILDKLCALELDGVRRQLSDEQRENANLRSDLMYARGQASQIDQTAQIRAGQNAAVASLVNELRSCPIPAQPVYGNQPIFTCNGGQNGFGCGCGATTF